MIYKEVKTDYGTFTLMPNGSSTFDLYDAEGNFIDEIDADEVADNEDDDEGLAILIEDIVEGR